MIPVARSPTAARLVVACVLAALALATAAALVLFRQQLTAASREGASGHAVAVVGPGARVLFNATVRAENATAYSALLAAARAGRFDVDAREGADGLHVRAVAGYAEQAAGGWIYEIARGAGTFRGDGPPDRFPLAPGDRLAWRWADAGADAPTLP